MNKIKLKILRFFFRNLGLCEHEWDIGMYKGTIHKHCKRCKKLVDTGI